MQNRKLALLVKCIHNYGTVNSGIANNKMTFTLIRIGLQQICNADKGVKYPAWGYMKKNQCKIQCQGYLGVVDFMNANTKTEMSLYTIY